jgi:hypothetical protein
MNITEEKKIYEIQTENGSHLAFCEEGKPFYFDGDKIVIYQVDRTEALTEYLKNIG